MDTKTYPQKMIPKSTEPEQWSPKYMFPRVRILEESRNTGFGRLGKIAMMMCRYHIGDEENKKDKGNLLCINHDKIGLRLFCYMYNP
jgi:hypothetical protein